MNPLSSIQVFAWGCGSCLGCGSSETTSLRPRLVEDLSITKIIDISCGDSHCLALSHGKWIYQQILVMVVVRSNVTAWLSLAAGLFCVNTDFKDCATTVHRK